ncbi:M20/M25/M40 family metallo-hydrolase [Chitinivibrio alkaliphilus]|uniref:Peptidase T-like protein n=1 Tax=Chitinivibrio alkaliphilus ACht1 TaxID=1313304 RepID=U7D383_9BACT|nr:M20/M25/M40 family metallo-hydrolase [Chitinivibrio alkaliphilus]ERP30964.1 peptidase T-like protein [Chitinivibrio alkaliphilus ACht1]
MIQRDRLLNTFLELVKIPGESRHEAAVADYLASLFTQLGLSPEFDTVQEYTSGNCSNMHITIPGTVEEPPLLISAHMDTVPTGGEVVPIVEEGYVRSAKDTILGADDRAGLAQIVEVVRVLREHSLSHPPLRVVITVAEEIGLLGARYCSISEKDAHMGLVLDTTGPMGKIVYQAPFHDAWRISVRGKSAHAGIAPEDGINAIHRCSSLLERIPTGRLSQDTTANIGRITGGTADNIVAEEVTIHGEVRSTAETNTETFHAQMRLLCNELEQRDNLPCTYTTHREYSGYTHDRASELIQRISNAVSACGYPPTLASTGGGSDANYFTAHGIPTAVISCGMNKVHTYDEEIALSDLYDTAKILLAFILGEK